MAGRRAVYIVVEGHVPAALDIVRGMVCGEALPHKSAEEPLLLRAQWAAKMAQLEYRREGCERCQQRELLNCLRLPLAR
jgi:hypothetical protein